MIPHRTFCEALGIAGREAIGHHRNDRTTGFDDRQPLPNPRSDMRSLATLLSFLQHDTPGRTRLLKLAAIDGISPRQCQYLSTELFRELDCEEASALWDSPWEKLPYPNRDECPPRRGLNTTRLTDVVPTEVKWLWLQRVPVGKLTILSGDPDLGKTWLVLDIAARVTTGRNFPDSPNQFGTRRDVLISSAEDDDADTIRPRIDILGGDPSRIHSLQFVRDNNKELTLNLAAHLDYLGDWLSAHPLVALVVLDPLAAYLGNTDSHRNSNVRALLSPLAKLAAQHQVAIIGINHLNKGDSDNAMYRGSGSIAFVAAARSCWLVTADPKQKDRRLFTKVKGNLQTDDVGGLAYRIGKHIPGVILWEPDPIHVTADETLRVVSGENNRAPALNEAKAWLSELLKSGPMLAAEIWERAKADSMSEKTVKSAKRALGIRTEKTGGPGTPWVWSLPKK